MSDTRDTRKKNANWRLNLNADGTVPTQDAHLAVLMDLRDELQTLNRLLHCQNFQSIPRKLDLIAKKLPTKRKRSRSNA